MLMGWGPFRFTVPNYSVEDLARKAAGRVRPVPVVGRKPQLHVLGPDPVRIDLQSTFHPQHMNRNGMTQLAGVRAAVEQQLPYILLNARGILFGRFVGVEVQEEQTDFAFGGTPGSVTTTLSLMEYAGPGGTPGGFGDLFR